MNKGIMLAPDDRGSGQSSGRYVTLVIQTVVIIWDGRQVIDKNGEILKLVIWS